MRSTLKLKTSYRLFSSSSRSSDSISTLQSSITIPHDTFPSSRNVTPTVDHVDSSGCSCARSSPFRRCERHDCSCVRIIPQVLGCAKAAYVCSYHAVLVVVQGLVCHRIQARVWWAHNQILRSKPQFSPAQCSTDPEAFGRVGTAAHTTWGHCRLERDSFSRRNLTSTSRGEPLDRLLQFQNDWIVHRLQARSRL